MEDIIRIVNKYSTTTFGQWFEENDGSYSSDIKPSDMDSLMDGEEYSASDIIKDLGIWNKPMVRKSLYNLPEKTGDDKLPCSFKDVFNQTESRCIAEFVSRVIQCCIDKGLDKEKATRITKRALYTYPSFIQEIDFVNKIIEICKDDKRITVDASENLDLKEHTDVLIKYYSTKFRIWLFRGSEYGFEKAGIKILGKKDNNGKKQYIPWGIHMLCSADNANTYSQNGWYWYKESYIQKVVNNIVKYIIHEDEDNIEPHYTYRQIEKSIYQNELKDKGNLIIFNKRPEEFRKSTKNRR